MGGEIYAPEYLRSLKDNQLDSIANLIEAQSNQLLKKDQEIERLKAIEKRCQIILDKLDGAAQDIYYHKHQLKRLLNEQS